jgi:hypothetical protein
VGLTRCKLIVGSLLFQARSPAPKPTASRWRGVGAAKLGHGGEGAKQSDLEAVLGSGQVALEGAGEHRSRLECVRGS